MRYYARRPDAAQPPIVRAVRAIGATVFTIVGKEGEPDLAVGFRGHTLLREVKTPGRATHDKAHRLRQEGFHAAWRGSRISIWTTPEQAVAELLALPWVPPAPAETTDLEAGRP